ncbi:UEV domain-containing protein [Colletotrichum graminicola]|uniref:UEV domain-containing protein n=1 Tax=Colletotrichum graminicola (strain M1.001 / M2 / FGSC 10212) TaxID=645133 RepID=E3QBS7_COLGM|nr:UEV domain-containing protein [Colletotrichum graminicola M1.001]EFQ28416.1 UEV domain-containing protein [Colletotrichum graminicola M1.001]WDK20793.1 UEV domain-containing protein [Colletotrichum graminicola]
MPVPQHVLNWLYSVLTSEYQDVNRTYNDIAQTLSHYPSLSPRTDVHTFDNGASALLVHLSGTIPVIFRGTTYRFPISIWVPHAYPRDAPLVYVTPTETMMVRPGQHVDPQGQVYHPYLVGWAAFWDKSTILDFVAILRDIFAKEPPVIARQPGQQQPPPPAAPPSQSRDQIPPPLPPLPPDLAHRPASRPPTQISTGSPRPPPPPPKTSGPEPPYRSPPPPIDARHGPPLPPLPPGAEHASIHGGYSTSHSPRLQSQSYSRYDSAPPLPPTPTSHPPQPPSALPPRLTGDFQQHQPCHDAASRSPVPGAESSRSVTPLPHQQGAPPPVWQPAGQYQAQLQQQELQLRHQLPPQQKIAKPAPPPDLLDEPLTLSIPSPSSVPAPPIPPNPEKDALLHQLAQTLHSLRQRSRQQNETSMAGLQAQRTAMVSAFSTLQSEIGTLGQTSALLQSNANILMEALRKADSVIEGSSCQTAPDIDELLVAPTVVANQLYALVAEEKAMGDTIFVLGRAVERGRISPAVFAKTTRSLAREWYLKKALVRKIGKGMGLTA